MQVVLVVVDDDDDGDDVIVLSLLLLILIFRVGRMPWPKIDETHYHAQEKLSDKGHAIRELVA